MKRIIIALIIMFCLVGSVYAQQMYYHHDPNVNITFTWDANTETDLAGYRLYQTTSQGIYNGPAIKDVSVVDAGNPPTTSVQITNEGHWWFIVRAYDAGGDESPNSNEVELYADFTLPTAPANFDCQNLQIININISP